MIKFTLTKDTSQKIEMQGQRQRYVVRIFTCHGSVCYDLSIDGEPVLFGRRIELYQPLIPMMRTKDGEQFFILDEDGAKDIARKCFGKTQNLYFMEAFSG